MLSYLANKEIYQKIKRENSKYLYSAIIFWIFQLWIKRERISSRNGLCNNTWKDIWILLFFTSEFIIDGDSWCLQICPTLMNYRSTPIVHRYHHSMLLLQPSKILLLLRYVLLETSDDLGKNVLIVVFYCKNICLSM